jgi:hypothetical protein
VKNGSMQRNEQIYFCVCAGLRSSCSGRLGWPIREHGFERATEPILALVA